MILNRLFRAARKLRSQVREVGKTHLRSSYWANVREKFLEDNPLCAACASHKSLQVHHIKPFHLHPELELDPTNLITLCMDVTECHLIVGHGDSFRCYNPNVREDAQRFKEATDEDRKKLGEEFKANRLKDDAPVVSTSSLP